MRLRDVTIVKTELLPSGNVLVTYDDGTLAVARADGTVRFDRRPVTYREEAA